MPWGAVAIGSSVVSGLGSLIANMSANDRANLIQSQNFQQWMNLNIPDPKDQQIVLQKFVSQGQLDPKLQSAIQQAPTEFNKVIQDSGLAATQNKALSELESLGNNGGLRLQDKAALQEAQQQSQVDARSNRDAIASQMAQRGLSGSGFDVAARLSSQQGQADRDANNSLGVAATASDRALQAIEAAGSQAGQMSQQDLQTQQARAQAADSINQFNTQNLQNVNSANVGLQNYAQQYNLDQKQNIADKNTDLSNQQETYNKGLEQQQYENQIQQLQGATGTSNKQADLASDQGTNEGNAFTNIGGGISNAASAKQNQDFWANYFDSQNKKKLTTPTATGLEV